jgi:competence protein ComEC
VKEQLTSQALNQQPRPIFKNLPGLAVFIAVIGGMALADQFMIEWSLAIYILIAGMVALIGALFTKWSEVRNITGLATCVCIGIAIYSFAMHQYSISPLARYGDLAGRSKVTGIVDKIEETRRGHLRLVDVSEVNRDSVPLTMSGRLAVQLHQADEDAEIALPMAGDTITLFTDIFPLRSERNPYAGSYDDRLKYHYGANATAELNSRFDYYLRPTTNTTQWQDADRFFARIRAKCDRILSASIADTTTCAFVRAVVLGTRGDIPQSTVLDFKYSGLTHLLAISGFNIAVVSLLIAQGLLFFGIRRRSVRLPVTAIGVAFYCLVVGLEPSVLRALVMIELYILALALERKSDLTNIAALTALTHIFIDPMVVHDAGFQLSYAAVFGFALIQPHLSRLFEPHIDEALDHERTIKEWLRHSMILSLAAFLATAPILLFHFRQISLVVLVANLSAIPLAGMITTLGFLLIPLGVILPEIAGIYGNAISWSVHLLLTSSKWLAGLTRGGFVIDLSAWVIVLLSIGCLWAVHVKTRPQAILRIAVLSSFILVAGQFTDVTTTAVMPSDELSIMFADVGQGDAAILKTPGGKCYMFDFGPLQGEDPNFSARPYAPMMQVEGFGRVEAGFITHLHRDHYAAVYSAAYSDQLNEIYTVGDRTSDEFAFGLDSLVQARSIHVSSLHSGQVIDLDKGVKVYVLSPDSSDRTDHINNDRSLALKIVYGNSSILMLGDIEQSAESELVSRYGSFLKSDIVKVAHHGSISSSTPELVGAADPKFAIVSCGRNNQFGHPHRKVVSRWLRSGAEVLRTDLDGAIIMASNSETFRRIDWRQR